MEAGAERPDLLEPLARTLPPGFGWARPRSSIWSGAEWFIPRGQVACSFTRTRMCGSLRLRFQRESEGELGPEGIGGLSSSNPSAVSDFEHADRGTGQYEDCQ